MPPKFIEYKKRIDEFLLKFLSSGLPRFTGVNSWGQDITDVLSPFVINGKTVRGGLVLFAHESCDKPATDDALRVASAMELVHSGLLIHDDIIDEDRVRRGAKTVYVQYEEKAKALSVNDPIRFGQGMALCMGDITFFLATHLLSQCKNVDVAQKILATLSEEYQSVCFAQMQDVAFGFSKIVPSFDEIYAVYRYKTARYTFSLPLMVGAMLAGTTAETVSLFEKLGEKAGVLFQIQDDLLNLYGDPKITGKPVGSDLREEKKTLAYAYVYEHMTMDEKQHVTGLNNPHSDNTVPYLYELLKKYRVAEFLDAESKNLYTEAMEYLTRLPIDSDKKNALTKLIQFAKTRNA